MSAVEVPSAECTPAVSCGDVNGWPGSIGSKSLKSVVQFLDQEGRALLLAALGHLESESSKACRIAFVPNPSKEGLEGDPSVLTMGVAAATTLPSRRQKIGAFLQSLLQEPSGAAALALTPLGHDHLSPGILQYAS